MQVRILSKALIRRFTMKFISSTQKWNPLVFQEIVTYNIRAQTIVFDVEQTLIAPIREEVIRSRPGAVNTLERIHQEGVQVYLWSIEGKEHCAQVSKVLNLQDIIVDCFDKPGLPMSLDSTVAKIGFKPDVTVDNDGTKEIEGVNFIQVEAFWFPADTVL